MSNGRQRKPPHKFVESVKEMTIEDEDSSSDKGDAQASIEGDDVKSDSSNLSDSESPGKIEFNSAIQTPIKSRSTSHSPVKVKAEREQVVGGDITLKLEPGEPPKLARTASHKVAARSPPMFDNYEDKTKEAKGVFEVIPQCIYSAKYLGSTEHAMECDCTEEWGKNIHNIETLHSRHMLSSC
jgi:hypothetical protein